jgi:hypothetical protein
MPAPNKHQREFLDTVVKVDKIGGNGKHVNGKPMANLWLLKLSCGHQVTRYAGRHWNRKIPQYIYCTLCDKAGQKKDDGVRQDLLREQRGGS